MGISSTLMESFSIDFHSPWELPLDDMSTSKLSECEIFFSSLFLQIYLKPQIPGIKSKGQKLYVMILKSILELNNASSLDAYFKKSKWNGYFKTMTSTVLQQNVE